MNSQVNNIPTSGSLLFLQRTIFAIVVLCLMILACTPPFDRDGLIHHLQIPKLYLQHGGLYEIPELPFSYYPMNLDLLYMGALRIGSDILPKYIHMTFGLLTALLLFVHLKHRLSKTYAWLGAIFFLSTPVIVKLSITVYVDLGLVFFATASLFLLLRWSASGRRLHLLLAGICCGLGLGTKYNGLLVLFLLTAAVPVLFLRSAFRQDKSTGRAMLVAALFLFAALLAASPWLVRNVLWTGNPVYPLHDGLFNPAKVRQSSALEQESNSIRGVFATRRVLYQESLWQLLLLPARIFFEGKDDDPRYFDGRLNPFLFLLPMMTFLFPKETDRKARLERIVLAVFCLLYFLFAFNTSALRIRYLAPMVPFLVVLSMHGLNSLEMLVEKQLSSQRLVMLAWLLPTTVMLTWNGSYVWQQFKEIDPTSYISGRLSRDEYLTMRRPEYKVMQHANSNLPASAKILCVFMGWRGYYLNRPHSFDQPGNNNGLLAWLQQPEMSLDRIGALLAENGIGYLLIRQDLFNQWMRRTDATAQKLWLELERRHLRLLASHDQYALYEATF